MDYDLYLQPDYTADSLCFHTGDDLLAPLPESFGNHQPPIKNARRIKSSKVLSPDSYRRYITHLSDV